MAKTKRIGLLVGQHTCECGRRALSRTKWDRRWVFRRDHDLCQRCFSEAVNGVSTSMRRSFRRPITPNRPERSRELASAALGLTFVEAANDDRDEATTWLAEFVLGLARALDLDLSVPA